MQIKLRESTLKNISQSKIKLNTYWLNKNTNNKNLQNLKYKK